MYAKAWLVEQLDNFKNKKMHTFNLSPENVFRCHRWIVKKHDDFFQTL